MGPKDTPRISIDGFIRFLIGRRSRSDHWPIGRILVLESFILEPEALPKNSKIFLTKKYDFMSFRIGVESSGVADFYSSQQEQAPFVF